ncbi:MAG: hypothetical protein KBG28_26635 [Kofleriaceae bacterium]|nr:hypothetical protein [Kofleriaceae bacterium]
MTTKRPPASAKTKTKTKTKAIKPARAAASRPGKKQSLTEEALLAMARAGKVDAIVASCDLDADGDADRLAYKWLVVASDLGHKKKAVAAIGDVLEWSSLRYDDDGYETASAHWELAVAYLEGSAGLSVDLRRARAHLEDAFRLHDLDGLSSGTSRRYSAAPVLRRLSGKAKALLEDLLAQAPLSAGSDDDGGDDE